MPILSIITINYNDKLGLQRTCKSVQEQTVHDFEHIIIDGGSDDGSKEFIEKNKNYFNYCISEPDSGVYEAMNKGILRANGRFLLFLNSGDTLYNNSILSKVLPCLENQNAHIVYGKLYKVFENRSNFINDYPEKLDFTFFIRTSLGHPSTFIRKELFERYGNYRQDLKIVSDWEFFIKTICIQKVSYKKIDLIISNFHEGGLSTNESNAKRHKLEIKKVLIENFDLYNSSYEKISIHNQESLSYLMLINPQLKLITTNKYLRKALNLTISLFALILKAKRSV